MTAMGPTQVAQIVTALEHMRNVNYLHTASLAILVYDSLLTLDIEINHVWNAPWNVIKILYLVTRYFTFIDVSLNVVLQFILGASEETCKTLYQAGTWIILSGMCLAELIMTIRTWAVWGKSRWLGISLLLFFLGTWSAGFAVVGVLSGPYTFILQETLNPFLKGCLVTGGRVTFLQITWALLFVYDFVIMSLMLIPAYDVLRYGGGQSRLVRVVFRDGIIYYIYLFVMTLGNLIVTRKLADDYFTIILILERVIHTVLACRVVLHTREQAWKTDNAYVTTISGM